MKNYEEMLDELYSKLPEKVLVKERFEPPEFDSLIVGNQTIIRNFVDVANILRRDPQHLYKFITKELATAGEIDGKRLVLKGKFKDDVLNRRLNEYIKEFVLCHECGKPDTDFVTIEGILYLRCSACGARRPIRKI
jgi:translation initiation factor 2 subunit 2